MRRMIGICTLGLALAPGLASAEMVKSQDFVGEVERRSVTMQPRDGEGPAKQMQQAYVTVTTLAGTVPGQAQLRAAGTFAAKAGCRPGKALTAVMAGVTDEAAEFEVLCGAIR